MNLGKAKMLENRLKNIKKLEQNNFRKLIGENKTLEIIDMPQEHLDKILEDWEITYIAKDSIAFQKLELTVIISKCVLDESYKWRHAIIQLQHRQPTIRELELVKETFFERHKNVLMPVGLLSDINIFHLISDLGESASLPDFSSILQAF